MTAHGLASLCAAELSRLGVDASPEAGGVAWRGDARTMYRANLELRTASRVIARIGAFRARGFAELERHSARLPWSEFLAAGDAVELRVTCRKSKLYHERAVAERVARVLADTAGVNVVAHDAAGDDDDATGRLIVVRLFRDQCTISVDSSGTLLHQRGYRQALAKAPLRETLAASLVLASGWSADSLLIDPFCGSGTIPIEAALFARRIAPGIANTDLTPRTFAFEDWPGFEPAVWGGVVAAARAEVRDVGVRITGSDRDAGAITAAGANATRAGVDHDIDFAQSPLSGANVPVGSIAYIITNPPYGVRVGDGRELRALYAALGRLAGERLAGGSVTMLSADDRLSRATGLPLVEILATRNGGIPVRLVRAEIGVPQHPRHPTGVATFNDNEELS